MEESEDEHSHCRNCFRLKCQTKGQLPRNSCIVVTCPHLCGASFHSCKADEHKKLCSNEIVPCINSLYGCPRTMRRSECGHHLTTCPASVVYCTMEWNRWPVFSKERQERVPFVPRNHATSGQLDAALAMRDQRILYEAMRAPRRVCRSLRNRLTERFPAVPLMNSCSTFMEAAESSKQSAEMMSDEDQSTCAVSNAGDVELNLFRSTEASEITGDLTNVAEKVHVVTDDLNENEYKTESEVRMTFGDDEAEQLPMQFKGCDNDSVCGFPVGEPSLDKAVSLGVCHDKTDAVNCAPGFAAVVHDGKELANAQAHSFGHSDDFHTGDRAQIATEMCNSDQDVGDMTVTNECVQELLNISAELIGSTRNDILGKRNWSVVTSEIVDYNRLETLCERGFEKNATKNLSDTGLTEKLVFGGKAISVNCVDTADIGKDCADHVMIQNCPERNSCIEKSVLQNPDLEQFDAFPSQNIEFSKICSESLCGDTLDASNNEVNTEIHGNALKLNDDPFFHFSVSASSVQVQDNTDCSLKKGTVDRDASPGDCNHVPPDPDQILEMFFSSRMSPPTNPPPLTVQEVLSLDLNLESITRYQAKPRSMYTFLCAQNLRRDEYEWHFKNTHSEIHGGLNGWIEARCPLACYGCTYSIRRLNPLGGTLVYNTDVDSFGVRPDSWHYAQYLAKGDPDGLAITRESDDPSEQWSLSDVCDRSPELCLSIGNWVAENSTTVSNTSCESVSSVPFASDSNGHQLGRDDINKPNFSSGALTNGSKEQPCEGSQDENSSIDENILSVLPFEVLRHIARCLDSFSLCNLAMTCFYLREVCKSIVEDRGIVVQEWQKRQFESGFSWQVTYQVL